MLSLMNINMDESGFFFGQILNIFYLLTQIRILSKFLISLSKMCNSPPKKNSSILHESQDLSVFAKKNEISQKLKTFTHACTFRSLDKLMNHG